MYSIREVAGEQQKFLKNQQDYKGAGNSLKSALWNTDWGLDAVLIVVGLASWICGWVFNTVLVWR